MTANGNGAQRPSDPIAERILAVGRVGVSTTAVAGLGYVCYRLLDMVAAFCEALP